MIHTMMNRFLCLMVSLALLFLAVFLYTKHCNDRISETANYNSATAREAYQDRMTQTRMFMSQYGGR